MNTNTKERRQISRDYQFNYLIGKGYKRETYKEIDFFTLEEGQYFTLKVYRGTAANHIEYVNYRTEQRRSEVIQRYKDNYENGLKWKAEQKEKNKGKSSSHAAASAAIKAELLKNFPTVKFSVTSESFSMGNSVHISWKDGPKTEEVKAISGKYQYGHFNGMDDIYENTNSRDDIPQAKYVSESRSMSAESEGILKPIADALFKELTTSGNEQPFNCRSADDFLRRIFYACSFTGNPVNIVKTGVTCGLYSPEIFYKIQFDTPEVNTKQAEDQPSEIEIKTGELNIVDYSEKAFAVIGSADDLKLIQSKMYELGGKYNKYLKCGAGYIFSKKKLDEVTKALSEEIETTEPEQPQILALPAPKIDVINYPSEKETPKTNIFKLEYFKIIWHEGHQTPNFENTTFTNWEDIQKAFETLWIVNEKGQGGGYTKVKCEIKFIDQERIINRIDITDRVNNGDFNPSHEHIISYLQSIADEYEIEPISAPKEPETYNNLQDIRTAAEGGKVISLYNLSQLVNHV
jgi:ribosomal protein S28E/S33